MLWISIVAGDSPLTKTSDDSSTETPPKEERASSKGSSSKLPVTIGAIAGGVVLVIIIVGIIVFVVRHQKTSENQPREPMHPMSIPDNPDYEHIRESQIDVDVHAYEIPNATFNDTFSEVNAINAVQQRY
ncbi:hypothetical protein CAPTEDRAFT_208732 [Capitella teleta]|uniref:Uncharacterized protein n=1 Tax=Capitella teleta TaxID=283909 RepID=R7VDH4_CAPTE|nr:hypothetical protein CAPTEDRAFT_208732 [Capitella teleta]|eukprot:ELU14361.1 hypothetical protein CAPTEDRAFT_208732 [Capitella teleta]